MTYKDKLLSILGDYNVDILDDEVDSFISEIATAVQEHMMVQVTLAMAKLIEAHDG